MTDTLQSEFIANAERWCATINPAAWIDDAPEWQSRVYWLEELHALFPPGRPAFRVKLRLRLPGGDRVDAVLFTVSFRRPAEADLWDLVPYYFDGCTVRATVRCADGLTRHHQGRIATEGAEMSRAFVDGLPPDVAQRVAALVRSIGDTLTPADLYGMDERAVLLAAINPHRTDGGQCVVCNRALRDEVSKVLGIGPDCAKRAGIPHTLAAAGAALSRIANA